MQTNLNRGIQLHREGKIAAALEIYREVLDEEPTSQAAHLAGRALFDLDRVGDSIPMLELATRLDPRNSAAFNDLGNVLSEASEFEKALAAYRRVLVLKPDDGQASTNLGICLRQLERFDEAREVLEQTIDRQPSALACYALGLVYRQLQLNSPAVSALRQATELQPDFSDAYGQLVAVLREETPTEFHAALADWIRNDPTNPVPQHLSRSSGEAPSRASDEYVRSVFDQFAETFEDSLADLNYAVPEQLSKAIQSNVPPGAVILDAGCGTGLCGPYLRPMASELVGVDLSEKMVEKARNRDLYDNLHVAELTQFMLDHPGRFDLVQAADTFNYFGDLAPVFSAAHTALQDSGTLIFSLERGEGNGFLLNDTGRYCHGKDYVRDQLKQAGFDTLITHEVQLRCQAEQTVDGWCIVAKKER